MKRKFKFQDIKPVQLENKINNQKIKFANLFLKRS